MNQLYGDFTGYFESFEGETFKVSGTFTTYPINTPRIYFPNIDLILALTEILPTIQIGQIQPLQQSLFLTEVDNEWQIGTVDNSQFFPINSPFYNSVKDIIIQAYIDKLGMV